MRTPGIEECYAWMECKLDHTLEEVYNGFPYALILGKVVYLEVEDSIYNKESGSWDLEKAKPLMMIGSDKGMHFCTVNDIGKFEPYGAMFESGKDPLALMYKKEKRQECK
ncbi:flavin reductase family protein [Methanosarcina sp. UBA5]|uniref:flavin reductase family protein n=1 Tax=Methanosarcina sp. UBA5 TaxID=1915593 RepID=UPI003742C003